MANMVWTELIRESFVKQLLSRDTIRHRLYMYMPEGAQVGLTVGWIRNKPADMLILKPLSEDLPLSLGS